MQTHPKPIGVHCMAGLGRTGTLICLYIHKFHGMRKRAGIAWLRLCRPGSVQVLEQEDFLLEDEPYPSYSTNPGTVIALPDPQVAMNRSLENIPPQSLDRRGSIASLELPGEKFNKAVTDVAITRQYTTTDPAVVNSATPKNRLKQETTHIHAEGNQISPGEQILEIRSAQGDDLKASSRITPFILAQNMSNPHQQLPIQMQPGYNTVNEQFVSDRGYLSDRASISSANMVQPPKRLTVGPHTQHALVHDNMSSDGLNVAQDPRQHAPRRADSRNFGNQNILPDYAKPMDFRLINPQNTDPHNQPHERPPNQFLYAHQQNMVPNRPSMNNQFSRSSNNFFPEGPQNQHLQPMQPRNHFGQAQMGMNRSTSVDVRPQNSFHGPQQYNYTQDLDENVKAASPNQMNRQMGDSGVSPKQRSNSFVQNRKPRPNIFDHNLLEEHMGNNMNPNYGQQSHPGMNNYLDMNFGQMGRNNMQGDRFNELRGSGNMPMGQNGFNPRGMMGQNQFQY